MKAGQILADGSSTEGGELAIGQNLLVAYAAWSGYNFEDGIVISDRLVYDDVFSSIHIKEFESEIRTEHLKYPEPLEVQDITTKFIPYASDHDVRNLSSNGFIKIERL